eukprot:364781-Chlamydomonas_euryale.AAC.19
MHSNTAAAVITHTCNGRRAEVLLSSMKKAAFTHYFLQKQFRDGGSRALLTIHVTTVHTMVHSSLRMAVHCSPQLSTVPAGQPALSFADSRIQPALSFADSRILSALSFADSRIQPCTPGTASCPPPPACHPQLCEDYCCCSSSVRTSWCGHNLELSARTAHDEVKPQGLLNLRLSGGGAAQQVCGARCLVQPAGN